MLGGKSLLGFMVTEFIKDIFRGGPPKEERPRMQVHTSPLAAGCLHSAQDWRIEDGVLHCDECDEARRRNVQV